MSKQLHTFEGMQHVLDLYTESGQSDTQFASGMSVKFDRPYSVAQVRQYRKTLGIANNKSTASAAGLQEKLARAKLALVQVRNHESTSADLVSYIDEFLNEI